MRSCRSTDSSNGLTATSAADPRRSASCGDGYRDAIFATRFDVMTAITVRIPDAMDKPLRDAASGSPSLNDYIVRAVRRQMTLDAARKLVSIAPLDLAGEGDAL